MHRFIHLCLLILLCVLLTGCTITPVELNTAEKLMESNPDSALLILRRINSHRLFKPSDKAFYALLMSQALDKNDLKVESDSLISIATDYYGKNDPLHAGYAWFYRSRCAGNGGNPSKQAEALLKAQEFAARTSDFKLKGFIFADKASMYGLQNQLDSSLAYYKLSIRAFKQSKCRRNTALGLVNAGYIFQFYSMSDSAIAYYHAAEKLAILLKDNLLTSTIYKSLGSVYFQDGNYNAALDYYERTPMTGIEIYDSNKWYLLASIYEKTDRLQLACNYLNKIRNPYEMAPDYYLLWQKIKEKEGNLTQALYYAGRVTITKDSLSQRALSVSFAGLEKKYQYKQLEIQNKDLIIKNTHKSILFLLSLIIISLLALASLLWRLRVKKQQLEAQKLLNEKVKENIHLLEQKVKMGNILLLNVEQYRKHSLKRFNRSGVKQGIVNPSQNRDFHKELISCMDLQYKDISGRLLAQYANLTEREILICCLLLANFDTGMIASILDIKNESMNTNRTRLRKKLGLQNNHNLEEFLRVF